MSQVSHKVTLIGHTPNAEELIASAARLCYASDTSKIFEDKESKKFVERLITMGHMSPIEHASFTFYIEGVSRAFSHQLVRHRIASYSQRSQRYVAEDHFNYVIPPTFEGKIIEIDGKEVKAADYFRETMGLISSRYATLNDALGRTGESSNEDARYVLPNACETKIFVTMNARELWHFFEERLCNRAQWEIRGVAHDMYKLASGASPALFEGAGPKCIKIGKCPEGKKTCGHLKDIQKLYVRGA
jgi:thymidylate synthase (FAD)